MTRHYTCRWCWWGCHSWWHDLLNMLPWGQRQGVPLTLGERIAYDAGFRAAIAKIDADLRAEGLGLRDQLGLAALQREGCMTREQAMRLLEADARCTFERDDATPPGCDTCGRTAEEWFCDQCLACLDSTVCDMDGRSVDGA